jgi:hypothetical protein
MVGCSPAEPTMLTKTDYIEVFNSLKTTYTNYLELQAGPSPSSYTVSDGDFVDANNNNQAKSMAKASLAMVYFLRNIYQNEDYQLKNSFDDCVVNDGDNIYDIRIENTYDNQTNLINVSVCADYVEEDTIMYFVFEIDYNFSAKVLHSFTILGYSGPKTEKLAQGVNYFKFANNNLKYLNPEAGIFAQFSASVLSEMDAYLAPQRMQDAPDYSEEYLSAMMEAFA